MAWVDDRIWCHPKMTGLSAEAFRVYVHGLAFSAGLSTGGLLTADQQKLIGSDLKTRRELIRKRLWDQAETGSEITIHDWKEHNGKRDARRAADRERKRLARAKERDASAGQDADKPADIPADKPEDVRRTDSGQNVGPARVEGSDGSEGRQRRKHPLPQPLLQDPGDGNGAEYDQALEHLDQLLANAAPQDIQW